jgi:threonine synthase
LVRGDSLEKELDLAVLWFKDDTRNPSGSLKDRATDVGLQHAREQGAEIVVAASTGNAGSSLACLAAWYGQRAVIFVPEAAPLAKLTQILQYGAYLCPVKGSYDEAFDLSLKAGEAYGWYSRSTGINPVLSEGKKTVALEIAEELWWEVPDQVFVPVGDGCILGGVYKGFYDLLQLGWIERLPRLVAVQAEGSAAVVQAWESGRLRSVKARTVADSIAVDFPRDGAKALMALKECEGYGLKVSDEEILAAQNTLAKSTGIFAEPAAAAALAGLIRAREQGLVAAQDRVVVLVTGSGLKDIPAAQKVLTIPKAIPPDLGEFQKQWERLHENS